MQMNLSRLAKSITAPGDDCFDDGDDVVVFAAKTKGMACHGMRTLSANERLQGPRPPLRLRPHRQVSLRRSPPSPFSLSIYFESFTHTP